jgi:1-acyl-sn-glycerol-3-phosphate acyltransferase
MMAHCRRHLARGSPILLFPEGTRALDGRLQRFKDGAFKLAWEAQVPIYPVVMTGTSDALPKHGLILRGGMEARVEVLDPLHPRDFDGPDALRDATRAVFVAHLPEAHRPVPAPAAAVR